MRSWYMLMAVFIMILAIMAFLLGRMELTDIHTADPITCADGYRLSGGSLQGNTPCPWQLESLSIRDTNDAADNDLQGKVYVSIRNRTGTM